MTATACVLRLLLAFLAGLAFGAGSLALGISRRDGAAQEPET